MADSTTNTFIGIEHFAIASPNPQRLADWYIGNLDFEVTYEYAGSYILEARNGALLEIIKAEGDRPKTDLRTPGIRHIAVAVTDFDAAYARLQSMGVTFLDAPYETQGNRVVFFIDIDGNILHLIQRGKPLR